MKFEPVSVTPIPPVDGPIAGLTESMRIAGTTPNFTGAATSSTPFTVTFTGTSMDPVSVRLGVTHSMAVAEIQRPSTRSDPKLHASEVESTKLRPRSRTRVPPEAGPDVGFSDTTDADGTY